MTDGERIVFAARRLAVVEMTRRQNPDGYGATAVAQSDHSAAMDELIRECYRAYVPGAEVPPVESMEERDRRITQERENIRTGHEAIRRAYEEAGKPFGPSEADMLRWAANTVRRQESNPTRRGDDPRIRRPL